MAHKSQSISPPEHLPMTKLNPWKMAGVVFAILLATAITSPAQAFSKIAAFKGRNGATPQSSLVQAEDGSLYGTTTNGGAFENAGTVFKISPQRKLTTLYDFCSQPNCADGYQPYTALLLATDGNFYGTTANGGDGLSGTIFKMTPQGSLTTLHSFDSSDGYQPFGPLIQATDGNFYGTTRGGGAHDVYGTVFRITSAGTLTTLHSFDGADGYQPYGPLIQATDGNFYGTTLAGGPYINCASGEGCGTVFRITSAGTLTTLYSFCARTNCPDGAHPTGGVIQSSDGDFYGTTSKDGGDSFYGTVFKITPQGALSTLYLFDGSDGGAPYGPLLQATDGNFYGTTDWGGANGDGTIFQITPAGSFTTLHSFTEDEGISPVDALLQATDGAFYGTTSEGDGFTCFGIGCGAVFSLDLGLRPFVAFVHNSGRAGQTGAILGQGFTGTTSVSLNGTPAAFTVKSDTFLQATVPAGATSGYVTVTTPSGTLTSNVPFQVLP